MQRAKRMANFTMTSTTEATFWPIKGISFRLVDIAFDDNATASQLLLIVVAFAFAWFVIFSVAKALIRPLVHNKPWLLDALERDYERSAKKMLAELNIKMTKEEAISWTMNDWPRMQCIYLQHIAGSLFCIPSILGIGDQSVASSLAICGILSEIGWELQDSLEMILVRTFCKNGKAIWPDAIVAVFLVHHSLSSILGVPMVLFYRNNRSLHWLCFNLQFAAAVALAIGEYTKLLDVSRPSSLRQFTWLNFVVFVLMLWTRGFHWTYLCVDLFVTWFNDGAYWFLSIGVTLSSMFTVFNYLCCIKPFYRKFVKFLAVSGEYKALPPDASNEKRRRSVIDLDEAVAEMLEGDGLTELAGKLESVFVKRTVSRRQSVQGPVQSRRRRSLISIRATSFGGEAMNTKAKNL
ncbi:hypothetical protein ACHAWF_016614 [Thalassiosira exigua]